MRRAIIALVTFLIIAPWVYAFRIPKPPIFSLPWTQDQIQQLNDTLENIWQLQNGEFNLDIVTSTKTAADNGDIWMIKTGTTVYIQYKGNNTIFTITPDGR